MRAPAPLPAVDPSLRAIRDELAAIEELATDDAKIPVVRKRRDALAERLIPADAIRLLEAFGFDFGEFPENPDFGKLKGAQWKKAQAEFNAIVSASYHRGETLALLYRAAANDLSFQERAIGEWSKLPGGAIFQSSVLDAIFAAKELAPKVLAVAKHNVRTRKESVESANSARALFRLDPAIALAEIGPLLADIPETADALNHAKMLVQSGTASNVWSRAPDEWRPVLEPLVARTKLEFDPYSTTSRPSLQLGNAAAEALQTLSKAKPVPEKKQPSPKAGKPKRAAKVIGPELDPKLLKSSKGREKALDRLGEWVVDQLAAAENDDDASAILRGAITAFYDIREAGDQPRGEYAGHFFKADAVGLAASDRPVPWEVLAKRVGKARMKKLDALFDAAEQSVE